MSNQSASATSYLKRRPNAPTRADPTLYDAKNWWNRKHAGDGLKAGAPMEQRLQVNAGIQLETGFVTWDTQEKMFPRLDRRLALEGVGGLNPMVFDPETVEHQVWDPLNRALAERKAGKRLPLVLNPITTHSLARWTPSQFAGHVSRDPLQLPDNPAAEDKRRPLPSAVLAKPRAGKPKPINLRRSKWGSETRLSVTGPAHVASIHYPLKSPTVTTISEPTTHRADGSAASSRSSFLKPSPPGPPTPYPRPPDTPTVALYTNTMVKPEVNPAKETRGNAFRSIGPLPQHESASALAPSSPTGVRKRQAPEELTARSRADEPSKKRWMGSRKTGFLTDISTSGSGSYRSGSGSSSDGGLNSITEVLLDTDPNNNNNNNTAQLDKSPKDGSADVGDDYGLGMWQVGEYDVEDLHSIHPAVLREYIEASKELKKTDEADTAAYDRAYDRFERARSQFKAVLKEEPETQVEAQPAADVRSLPAQQSSGATKKVDKYIPGLTKLYGEPLGRRVEPKVVRFEIGDEAGRDKENVGRLAEATGRALSRLAITNQRIRGTL
ncbi:hypothetical protein GGS20DRAFT_113412 [Poronia punctata]|nr:hypothetical protein GGS20DRAFT_113412 [Poronia punctata]